MATQELRNQQRDFVKTAYDQLNGILAGEFAPGYFNSPRARAAESRGLSVIDAVLGHVVSVSPDSKTEARALELLNRVSRSLVASEVENQCHNLHAACALMLDALDVPVVMVWGSVYATGDQDRAFWLNAEVPILSQEDRPGHSWLLTPSLRVADLALVHQNGVPGDYGEMRGMLPRVTIVTSNEASEPEVNWWQSPDACPITAAQYAKATRYQDVIGWSQYKSESTTVRYLPGAVVLPDEDEMGDLYIKIGGLSAREFFVQKVSDLVPS